MEAAPQTQEDYDLFKRWDSLDAKQLTEEVATWREFTIKSLESWLSQFTSEAMQQILEELMSSEWEAIPESQELPRKARSIQARVAEARHHYLVDLGPSSHPSINAIVLQLDWLQDDPERTATVGYAILHESRNLSSWSEGLEGNSEALNCLTKTLEQIAFALLQDPTGSGLRDRVLQAWEKFLQEQTQEAASALLRTPTRSRRWNSWILLLQETEAGREPPQLLLDGLNELDQDMEELESAQASENLQGCLQDYFEASRQLRDVLESGRRLKGWSQILPPLLEELDTLLTSPEAPEGEAAASSQVARLCQDYEDSRIDGADFHAGLEGFRASLAEARRQANLPSKAQDPQEIRFVEALSKLERGLESLEAVESPAQNRQLAEGCALIEEGLRLVSELQT